MTTTELIDLLKKYEHGGATGRPREITLTVNGAFMPHPHFYVDSTDDGLLYTGICIGVSGDAEQEADNGCAMLMRRRLIFTSGPSVVHMNAGDMDAKGG